MHRKSKNMLGFFAFTLLVSALFFAFSKEGGNSDLTANKIGGLGLYQTKDCGSCHTLGAENDGKLTAMKSNRNDSDRKWFMIHIGEHSKPTLREPRRNTASSIGRVHRAEAKVLSAFLFDASADEKKRISEMEANIVNGGMLFAGNCSRCHMVAGEGGDSGPELNRIGAQKDAEWLMKNLVDPSQFSPDTDMPSFEDKLTEEQRKMVVDYMLTLQ